MKRVLAKLIVGMVLGGDIDPAVFIECGWWTWPFTCD